MNSKSEKWIFKVVEGLPVAELTFYDHLEMKEFSGQLSALYPNIVTDYVKIKAVEE